MENLLSLSGVYQPKKELKESKIPVALTTFLKANPQINTIYLHLDKDRAGRLCTAALKELLQKDYINAPKHTNFSPEAETNTACHCPMRHA